MNKPIFANSFRYRNSEGVEHKYLLIFKTVYLADSIWNNFCKEVFKFRNEGWSTDIYQPCRIRITLTKKGDVIDYPEVMKLIPEELKELITSYEEC